MEPSPRAQIGAAAEALRQRLPQGWEVDVVVQPQTDAGRPDAIIRVGSPDGTAADLVVDYRSRLDPVNVGPALAQLARWPDARPMLMAPFVSLGTRRLLREHRACWADATGNLCVALDKPAVFVEVEGAAKNPFRRSGAALKSLRGPGAAAVVRAFCDYRPPYTLVELAHAGGLSIASVFRVADLLLRESLVEKAGPRGSVVSVDWAGVIRRWCDDYSLLGSNRALGVIEPRGPETLLERLRETTRDCVVTASAVAARVAPVAPSRLVVVFTESPQALATELGLTATDAGANALLVEPFAKVLMQRADVRDGLRCASLTQVAADLLTSPGRGPAEAESLMSWMKANEQAWRRTRST